MVDISKLVAASQGGKAQKIPTSTTNTNAPKCGTKAARQAQGNAQTEFLDTVTRARDAARVSDSGIASLQREADANKLLNDSQRPWFSNNEDVEKLMREMVEAFSGGGCFDIIGVMDSMAKALDMLVGDTYRAHFGERYGFYARFEMACIKLFKAGKLKSDTAQRWAIKAAQSDVEKTKIRIETATKNGNEYDRQREENNLKRQEAELQELEKAPQCNPQIIEWVL